MAALLFLGAARIAFSGPDLAGGHIAAYNDQGNFRLTAVVDAPPDLRDQSTLLRMRAEQITPLDNQSTAGTARPTHGMLLVLVPGRADWQYGDRLELDGKLTTPPEGETFSYRAYLARQDIYTYLTYPRVHWIHKDAGNPLIAAIYRLRDWSYREVYHLFPAPEAPLLAGILLGIDSDMPDSLADAFRDTGTAHVIAISGFNIAILAELFSKLFGKVVSRWWATLLSIFAISLYTLMVGAAPSVVRAAIMGSFSLIALQIGRRSAGLNTLGLTAALMCLPLALPAVGCQLPAFVWRHPGVDPVWRSFSTGLYGPVGAPLFQCHRPQNCWPGGGIYSAHAGCAVDDPAGHPLPFPAPVH